MKKIVSMIAGILVLISAAVTAGAEKISIANEKYPAPGYAGAVFVGTVEDINVANNGMSLFSTPEESLADYIYNKLMDIEWCNRSENQLKHEYSFTNSKKQTIKETDLFVVIHLNGYTVSEQDLSTTMDFLINEAGELLIKPFYLTGRYNDDEIAAVLVSFAYDMNYISEYRTKIKNKADDFIESLGDYKLLSQRERVLLTHDFIADIAHYTTDDADKFQYHTLYSALIQGETVCQGYTQAMCYILNQIEVECVSCLHKDGSHVWNCVNVDGQWSHVDLTWDDARRKYYMDNDKIKVAMFDPVFYDNFMTDAATMIAKKKNGYDPKEYNGNLEQSEFTFPSGKLLYNDTIFEYNNSEYTYNCFKFLGLNDEDRKTYFIPSGCKYENGKIKHIYKQVDINNELVNKYEFLYDNLIPSVCTVSVPEKLDNGYSFILLPLKGIADNDNINIYMASYENNITQISKLTISYHRSRQNGLHIINAVSNNSQETTANQAKFFFWDSNMRPYTQPTYKSIQ